MWVRGPGWLAGRQARQAGSTGAGVEEHRSAGKQEAEQNGTGDFCSSQKIKGMRAQAKHRNMKNSEFPESTEYRHCVVTVWDVTIWRQSGGETRYIKPVGDELT